MLSIWQFYSWTCSHENESISVKLTSLTVGVFEKISVEHTFPHFLPFNLLSKSLISSDLQWLAKLGSTTLKSAHHNFRPQKKKFRRRVSGELWEVWDLMAIALVSGYQAVWVQALAGEIVLCFGAWQVYKWVLTNLMLGVTLWWTSIPSRGE